MTGNRVTARLSTAGDPVCAPDWLALREPADAAARAAELVPALREHLAAAGHESLIVRDLGCGTGSMGRWLVGRLVGPQHWVLYDRDPVVLARAAVSLPEGVTTETVLGDLTDVDSSALMSTSLVTASALLDLLTADEVEALVARITAARVPALFTLSVLGGARLDPAEPLDLDLADAFDAHQRRQVGQENGQSRRLLGPDALEAVGAAFTRRGYAVATADSPWTLDSQEEPELVEEWLRGWIEAACARRPDLDVEAPAYLARRLGHAQRGGLRVLVPHADLLALPTMPGAAA